MTMQLEVSFRCECGHKIAETIWIPSPDFSAETSRDSVTDDYQDLYCPKCNREHKLYITNSFSGANVLVNDGRTDVSIGFPYFPEDEEIDWAISSKRQIDTYRLNVSSVQELISTITTATAKRSLLVMLYAHVVASTEAYLATTFIHRVINSEELTLRLIETDPELAKQTFSLKDIYTKREQMKLIVPQYLNDLIFHKLDKVKPMYRSVLDVDFGDISWLFKAVLLRHDCVHRAGYDKKGKQVDISEESVLKLARKCTELVEMIESTLLEKDIESEIF